uniref:Uncharacterized protein n=1 Tax=Corethron hystrix TaxID=216773 RepID=A0A7S1BIC2_9STRA|mmetsp:Transcript_29502/g.67858  ORF Transcript_29502/g.67858 Transcript_29502/m.67858 type:complete len:202 (+) Transcript_29502:339-944(+)
MTRCRWKSKSEDQPQVRFKIFVIGELDLSIAEKHRGIARKKTEKFDPYLLKRNEYRNFTRTFGPRLDLPPRLPPPSNWFGPNSDSTAEEVRVLDPAEVRRLWRKAINFVRSIVASRAPPPPQELRERLRRLHQLAGEYESSRHYFSEKGPSDNRDDGGDGGNSHSDSICSRTSSRMSGKDERMGEESVNSGAEISDDENVE